MDKSEFCARYEVAVSFLSNALKEHLLRIPEDMKIKVNEVRLRIGQPVCLSLSGVDFFLKNGGGLVDSPFSDMLICTEANIKESFSSICGYSVHAYQNEIKNGFVTLRGGHRAGFCGSAVFDESGRITNVKNISSINVRIAKEVVGCADELVRRVVGRTNTGVLIAGSPGSGKTTVIRDIARQLSCGTAGRPQRVCIVDERSEIAAVYKGIPQNNLGPRCDVLDGYPKAIGIITGVKVMSPDVIICDELGSDEELLPITSAVNSGVRIIATVHAENYDMLMKRKAVHRLMDTGAFGTVVFLDSRMRPGVVKSVVEIGDDRNENRGDPSGDRGLDIGGGDSFDIAVQKGKIP